MKPIPTTASHVLRKAFRLAALAAVLSAPLAHADEYGDVNLLVRSGKLTEALGKADQYLFDQLWCLIGKALVHT